MVSPASLPVVETAADITPEWLTAALTAAGHLDQVVVTDVTSRPIGTGQVASALLLTIRYDGPTEAPATLIAKLADTDPEMRKAIKEHGLYEKEVRFYQQLYPDLTIRVPRPYYADLDEGNGTFVLLLEDMSPAQQGDQIKGCSLEIAEVAVNGLVGLHAPRWGDPTLAKLGWLHDYKIAERQMKLQATPQLWAGFKERYQNEINDEVVQAGEALVANLQEFLYADTQPWTVVHGDYRLDNMLIKATADDIDIAAVDWQTCTHGPALDDVAYFLGGGLPIDVRRENEERLVRGYHARLVDAGVTGYDWDRCWTDYRRGTWSGLMMAIYASMLVERTNRGDEMFMAMAHRHANHALDLHAEELIASAPPAAHRDTPGTP